MSSDTDVAVPVSPTIGIDAAKEREPELAAYESYQKMDKNALMLELEKISNSNADDSMLAAAALAEKIDEFTDDELLSVLQGDKYGPDVKVVLIQTIGMSKKEINNPAPFWSIAADPNTEAEVRSNIITFMPMGADTDHDILVQLVWNDEGMPAFDAMDRLSIEDFDKALELADRILNDDSEYSTELVLSSAFVKAEFFREKAHSSASGPGAGDQMPDIAQDKQQFIELCLRIFDDHYDPSNYPNKVTDGMVLALKDMQDFAAVKAIITHEKIDDDSKASSVYDNYPAIESAVQAGLSPEEIDALLDVMKIQPVVEVVELLDTHIMSEQQQALTDSLLAESATKGISIKAKLILTEYAE